MKQPWFGTREACILAVLAWLSKGAYSEGLLAINNPAKNAAEAGAYAEMEAFQGNDAVAMRQYVGQWQGSYAPRDGTNLGVIATRAETGAQWQGWRLGALYRADALAQTNRDTTDLTQQYNTRSGYDVGRTYLLDYQLKGFEVDGARLSKSFKTHLNRQWALNWGTGASLLRGQRVKIESAAGQVITLSAQNFNANVVQSTSDSSTDTSGNGNFNPPFGAHPALTGQGYALDWGMLLQHADGLRLEAAINDLAGSMSWKNIPQFVANYNTATKTFDADGYVHFNPTATAQSSYHDINQTLDPKFWLAVAFPWRGVELQAASSYTSGYWFPELGLSYALSPQWQVAGSYDVRFGTVGISVKHPFAHLTLRTSDLNPAQAKAYGFVLGVTLPL